jgi:hypothetical protein
MPGGDLDLDLAGLTVELLQLFHQPLHQQPKRPRQLIARILDQLRHSLGDMRDALRDDQPEFRQQASDLVGLRGTRLHEALPGPVCFSTAPAARRS